MEDLKPAPAAPPAPSPGIGLGAAAFRGILGLLLVAVFFAIARRLGFVPPLGTFLERLREIPLEAFLAALGLMSLQVVVLSARYFLILDRTLYPGLRFRHALEALLVGQGSNLILPARIGDGVRVFRLHRRTGMPLVESVVALGLDKLFDTLSLAPWLLVALGVAAWAPRVGTEAAGPSRIAEFAGWGILFLLFVLAVVPQSRKFLLRGVARAGEALRRMLARPRALLAAYLVSLLSWACEFGAVSVLLRSLAEPRALAGSARAILGANAGLSVPLAPAGLGAFEAGVVGALALGGTAADSAWGIAVAYHFAQIGGILVVGFLFFSARAALNARRPPRGVSDISSKDPSRRTR